MARKRKIPVRKHHGVRDPLKQLEIKEKKLKNIVNCPPQKDDQKMSYKFVQFKKLADQAGKGQKIKRVRSGIEDIPKESSLPNKIKNSASTENKFKCIKQIPGEKDKDYMRRVNRITNASLKEAQYEAKYGVKVIRDPKTGEISIKKKPTNEIDELLKQKKKELSRNIKKNGSGKHINSIDGKSLKDLIKKAIQEDHKEKLEEKGKEIEEFSKDVIRFGEVVHAPPIISALPRKAQKNETVPRPGRKNLLLKDLLTSQAKQNSEIGNTKNGPQSTQSCSTDGKHQLKGRRKDLPEATRNMLEKERQKLVDLYRHLKKSRGKQGDNKN